MAQPDETREARLTEFLRSRRLQREDELAQIELAMFLEETYQVVLSDDVISPELIDTPRMVERLPRNRLWG